MHNWDYNAKNIPNTPSGIRFKLERMINYGLTDEKLPGKLLQEHLPFLKIDPKRREFLEFILWNK